MLEGREGSQGREIGSGQSQVLLAAPVNQLLPLGVVGNQGNLPDGKLDQSMKFQTSWRRRTGLCFAPAGRISASTMVVPSTSTVRR